MIRLLSLLIPRAQREFIVGDLEELYGSRRLRLAWQIVRTGSVLRLGREPRDTPSASSSLLRTRRPSIMATFTSDLRFGLRQLLRSPGFTVLSVLTLALGIGATTAIYSVVRPVLFQSLPYPDADRIVTIWQQDLEGNEDNTGYATFVDVQRMTTSFEAIAVTSSWQPTLQGSGEPERLDGQRVTADFLRVLGVRPALGRDFTASEHVRGQHRVTILSHGLWQRRFGGDPSVIGRPITFDGIQYTIVGVMPRTFESLLSPTSQLWAPLGYEVSLPWACRTCHHLKEIGRLKPGVSAEAARRELDLISGRLLAQYPGEYQRAGMFVIPLQTRLTRDVRPALLALLGAVVLVLLIACANVSGLLLGRALQRESEFAVRSALGAARGRVVRQLLTESLLLSVVGAAVGIALAWWGVKGLVALGPPGIPRLDTVGINTGVLGFTALVTIATGFAFGLVPAIAAAKPDLFSALRPGGRHTGHRTRRMARAVLVAGEIAMALMLLVGAGLLLRSLQKLLAVDPGFDPGHLLTLEVQTTGARYQEDAPVWAYWDRALAAVRAVPGVESAALTSQLPLGGNFDRYGVQIEGKHIGKREEAPSADRYSVSAGYLETMRIPLKRGRSITDADIAKAPPVVLINETFAKLEWAGEDPIGKKVQMGGADRPWRTVVGIVGDVRHTGLDERQAPQIYLPEAQGQFADGAMAVVVRTRGDPAEMARPVQAAIRSADPTLPILNLATMDDVISSTARQRRFAMVLFQVFAGVALVLAAAGVYGVLAGNVTERTREIGIRSALGAPRSGLLSLVVGQGFALAAAGIVIGAGASLLLSRFLHKMLYGIDPQDPVTFAGGVLLLLVVVGIACFGPAWRAVRVSPLEAIRGE